MKTFRWWIGSEIPAGATFEHMSCNAMRQMLHRRGKWDLSYDLEWNSRRACDWELFSITLVEDPLAGDPGIPPVLVSAGAANHGEDFNFTCKTCSMLKEEITS